jgi:hypothetical protein
MSITGSGSSSPRNMSLLRPDSPIEEALTDIEDFENDSEIPIRNQPIQPNLNNPITSSSHLSLPQQEDGGGITDTEVMYDEHSDTGSIMGGDGINEDDYDQVFKDYDDDGKMSIQDKDGGRITITRKSKSRASDSVTHNADQEDDEDDQPDNITDVSEVEGGEIMQSELLGYQQDDNTGDDYLIDQVGEQNNQVSIRELEKEQSSSASGQRKYSLTEFLTDVEDLDDDDENDNTEMHLANQYKKKQSITPSDCGDDPPLYEDITDEEDSEGQKSKLSKQFLLGVLFF